MKHSVSGIKVYQSKDYKLFRSIDGNRSLNKKKIERIIREINSGNDILAECPILVRENGKGLEVVDGQHRVEISRALGRPVHYIIKQEKMSLYQIAKVNSNVEKWTPEDFINCYAKAGNENYLKLGKFHKKYRFAVGMCLSLLTFGIAKHDVKVAQLYVEFEHGRFEIKTWKEAVQFAEICQNFSSYKNWRCRGFVMAMSKIIAAEKCDIDVLLSKFSSDPSQLTYHSDWKGFIANLEQIYNKGNQKRRYIF